MRRGAAAPLSLLVLLLAASCAGLTPADRGSTSRAVASPLPALSAKLAGPLFWIEAPIAGDPSPIRAHVPDTGAVVVPGGIQLLPPAIVPGPRRVAIQAGHWKVEEAPDEFPNLRFQFGGSVAGVDEVAVTLDIADRVAVILRAKGILVDVLPATIPPSYVADAFVSLHADDDGFGSATGFKVAHGFYRGQYDDALVDSLTSEYGAATGLPININITDDMTDYYAFAWFRYEHALAPHTPAAIIEMAYLSNTDDRAMLTDEPGVIAQGVANGVLRFLEANPRAALFADAIVVPTVAAPAP
jgi:N-acetylmuramoyl-L-alanine amidase